ncbi:hypothetical protein E4U53_002960, partial [Claviceps sorghi]
MDALKVPESGWLLSGSPGPDSDLPPQAFVLNLSDDVVGQMIRSARMGDGLELQLGKTPTLHFGSHSHQIPQPEDDVPFDVYLTKPFESTRRAERIPHAGNLFTKLKSTRTAPKKASQASKEDETKKASQASKEDETKKASQASKEDETKKQPAVSSKSSTSSGLDSDIEALQNGLAAHDAARDR